MLDLLCILELKHHLPVSTYAGAEKLKEINEDELRKYNEQLRERGVTDKIGRRKGIYDIYASIEDEDDEWNIQSI
jgi:predicted transcriptional regulator of viral defense system